MRKPILTSEQLVQQMKTKGVLFTIITEDDAKNHLYEHNNYFRLTSYRKNYTKYTTGEKAGKYENLEFVYLRELARLDTEIRRLLLDMTLDVEHFMKVILLNAVENQIDNGEDGYKIVSDYLFNSDNPCNDKRAEAVPKRSGIFRRKVTQNKNNPYCSGLVKKYADEMPIWVYVELISFGDLNELAEYYSKKTNWIPPIDMQSLDRVRQIRNACAHGNVIINDLRPVQNNKSVSIAPPFITQFVTKAGVSKLSREKKLSNPRINQIVHLLYIYDKIVTGKYTRNLRLQELNYLISTRIPEHKEYFKENMLLVSTYRFFKKIVSTMEKID